MNRTAMRLGWSLFMRKWWMQLLIMIQLGITLFLGNVLVCQLSDHCGALWLFRRFDDNKVAFFMPQDKASGVLAETGVGYEVLVRNSMKAADGQMLNVTMYGSGTADALMPVLNKSLDSGCVPCAASAPYRKGDRIEVTDSGQKITLQVVDTLHQGERYFSYSVWGNGIAVDKVCEPVGQYIEPTVLLSQAQWPVELMLSTRANMLVFFDSADHAAEDARLREVGFLVTMGEARANTREEAGNYTIVFLGISLATFLIGIVSMIGLLLLQTLRQMRTFVIFHVCGMSRRQLGCIGRMYGMCLSLGAAVLAVVGWFMLEDMHAGLMFGWMNVVITVVLLALPILLADVLPRRLVPKENPITAMTETGATI